MTRLPDPIPSTSSGVTIAPGLAVPESVLRWSYARSSGPGGQNVNKLETKAELRVWLELLPIRARVLARLRTIAGDGPGGVVGASSAVDELTGNTFPVGGELVLTSQSHRSQSANKEECLKKLRDMLLQAKVEPKVRRKTKPSKGSVERRIGDKKKRGENKRNRGEKHD